MLLNSPNHNPIYLALLLTLPSLWVGLQFDDYLHQQTLHTTTNPLAVAQTLFKFQPYNPPEILALMEQGVLPWWSNSAMQLAFWRPLSALTHWLDYQLWPHTPWLMHAHSLIWFGLLLWSVGKVYSEFTNVYTQYSNRQIDEWALGQIGKWVTARGTLLALWLYALDDSHGFAIGWLANRNILIATFFGMLALRSYHQWRWQGRWFEGWLTPLWLLLGLLSAEGALAIVGYLVAYTLHLEPYTPSKMGQRRWLALLPAFLVILFWQFIYRWLGYGVYGTAYADPSYAPLYFMWVLVERIPILLMGQFIWPWPEVYNLMAGWTAGLFWCLAVLVCLGLGWSLLPLWQANPLARFWITGMLLALLPACVIFPANRLLFFVGFGAMGIVALIIQGADIRPNRLKKTVQSTLIILHLISAPCLLPLMAYSPALLGNLQRLATDISIKSSQTLVILNAPSSYHAAFIPYLRQQMGLPVPQRVRVLATTPYSVQVQQVDNHTVLVEPHGGYLLGIEGLFQDPTQSFYPQQSIYLSDLRITIITVTTTGRPSAVQFRFQTPLADEQLVWVYWHKGQYQPYELP